MSVEIEPARRQNEIAFDHDILTERDGAGVAAVEMESSDRVTEIRIEFGVLCRGCVEDERLVAVGCVVAGPVDIVREIVISDRFTIPRDGSVRIRAGCYVDRHRVVAGIGAISDGYLECERCVGTDGRCGERGLCRVGVTERNGRSAGLRPGVGQAFACRIVRTGGIERHVVAFVHRLVNAGACAGGVVVCVDVDRHGIVAGIRAVADCDLECERRIAG